MKKRFKTREALLQDTINYYWGKPERLCISSINPSTCQYQPSETSDGCAIGRLVSLKTAKILDYRNYDITLPTQFAKLPKWLQNLGYDFLGTLQLLHDGEHFAKRDKNAVNRHMAQFVDVTKITFPEI